MATGHRLRMRPVITLSPGAGEPPDADDEPSVRSAATFGVGPIASVSSSGGAVASAVAFGGVDPSEPTDSDLDKALLLERVNILKGRTTIVSCGSFRVSEPVTRSIAHDIGEGD